MTYNDIWSKKKNGAISKPISCQELISSCLLGFCDLPFWMSLQSAFWCLGQRCRFLVIQLKRQNCAAEACIFPLAKHICSALLKFILLTHQSIKYIIVMLWATQANLKQQWYIYAFCKSKWLFACIQEFQVVGKTYILNSSNSALWPIWQCQPHYFLEWCLSPHLVDFRLHIIKLASFVLRVNFEKIL